MSDRLIAADGAAKLCYLNLQDCHRSCNAGAHKAEREMLMQGKHVEPIACILVVECAGLKTSTDVKFCGSHADYVGHWFIWESHFAVVRHGGEYLPLLADPPGMQCLHSGGG